MLVGQMVIHARNPVIIMINERFIQYTCSCWQYNEIKHKCDFYTFLDIVAPLPGVFLFGCLFVKHKLTFSMNTGNLDLVYRILWLQMPARWFTIGVYEPAGGRFNTSMLSYRDRNSNYKHKTVLRSPYLYDENPNAWKDGLHMRMGPGWYRHCVIQFMVKTYCIHWPRASIYNL